MGLGVAGSVAWLLGDVQADAMLDRVGASDRDTALRLGESEVCAESDSAGEPEPPPLPQAVLVGGALKEPPKLAEGEPDEDPLPLPEAQPEGVPPTQVALPDNSPLAEALSKLEALKLGLPDSVALPAAVAHTVKVAAPVNEPGAMLTLALALTKGLCESSALGVPPAVMLAEALKEGAPEVVDVGAASVALNAPLPVPGSGVGVAVPPIWLSETCALRVPRRGDCEDVAGALADATGPLPVPRGLAVTEGEALADGERVPEDETAAVDEAELDNADVTERRAVPDCSADNVDTNDSDGSALSEGAPLSLCAGLALPPVPVAVGSTDALSAGALPDGTTDVETTGVPDGDTVRCPDADTPTLSVTVAVKEGASESVYCSDSVAMPLALTAPAVADTAADPAPSAVAVPLDPPLPDAAPPLAQLLGLPDTAADPLTVEEAARVGVPPTLPLLPNDAVAPPLTLPAAAVALAAPLPDPRGALRDAEGEPLSFPLTDSKQLALPVPRALPDRRGVPVEEGVGAGLPEALAEAREEALTVGGVEAVAGATVALSCALLDAEAQEDARSLPESATVREGEPDALGEPVGLADPRGEAEARAVLEGEGDTVRLPRTDRDWEGHPLLQPLPLGERVGGRGEPLPKGEKEGLGEVLLLRAPDPVTCAEAEALALPDTAAVGVVREEGDSVEVTVGLRKGVSLAKGEGVLAAPEGEGRALDEGLGRGETLATKDTLGAAPVALAAGLPLSTATVGERGAERDSCVLLLPEEVAVAGGDRLVRAEEEALGEPLELPAPPPAVTLPPPLPLPAAEPDTAAPVDVPSPVPDSAALPLP